MLYRRALKAKIHYTSFPVASTQQVRSFSVYGEVTGKRVQWILGINKRYAGGGDQYRTKIRRRTEIRTCAIHHSVIERLVYDVIKMRLQQQGVDVAKMRGRLWFMTARQ